MKCNSRADSAPLYPAAELKRRKDQIRRSGIAIYDFGTGDPVEPTPQFIRDAMALNIPAVSQYPTVRGLSSCRRAVAGYLRRRFGVELDPDSQIIPSRGSKEAIYNLQFLLIDPGSEKKTVVMGVPGYPVQERSTAIAGGEFYRYPLSAENGYLLDLSKLSEDVLSRTAICWINYPHNPTGTAPGLAYFKLQAHVARQYDILLCSDECYVDIFTGAPPPSILQVATEGVLSFHSCSKRSGMTAYRTGFIAGDSAILEAYAKFRETAGVATPEFIETAAAAAWNDDFHVQERNRVFAQKRDVLWEFLRRNSFEFEPSEAAFYIWVKCPGGMLGLDYASVLLERGIVVSPGEFFGESRSHHIRLALVPSLKECTEAVRHWQEIL